MMEEKLSMRKLMVQEKNIMRKSTFHTEAILGE